MILAPAAPERSELCHRVFARRLDFCAAGRTAPPAPLTRRWLSTTHCVRVVCGMLDSRCTAIVVQPCAPTFTPVSGRAASASAARNETDSFNRASLRPMKRNALLPAENVRASIVVPAQATPTDTPGRLRAAWTKTFTIDDDSVCFEVMGAVWASLACLPRGDSLVFWRSLNSRSSPRVVLVADGLPDAPIAIDSRERERPTIAVPAPADSRGANRSS